MKFLNNIDKLEVILFLVLVMTTLLGLYWGFVNPEFFTNRYMMEDGEIEYGTVVLLLASCGIVAYRWWVMGSQRTFRFTLITLIIIAAFFFVAGEELSWGQRIFGLETTEYFKENNDQQELNLHNLVVGDVKINKLIFGVILTTAIMVYMVLIPFLYHRVTAVRTFLDTWYIPIPRLRHSLLYLAITLIISLIPASKNWELLEFESVLIFLLILWTPVNRQIFQP